MILNSHCPSCEFRDRCRAEAVNRDDLSLLRGMSEKEILAQRKRGINTVTQFACTFRPKSIGLKRSKPLKRHLHALQALAVRDKKVYVVRAPEIPAKTTRVYLDVEGIPDRDFYYLVGVVVEKDGECSAHSFWADDETEEQAIWVKLLELLRDLGDCTIFHYGAYEKAYIKKMLRKYPSPDTPFPGTWDSALFNVLGAIRTNVYFPAYSNGLKDIACVPRGDLDGQGHFGHRMHRSQASMGGVEGFGDQGRDPRLQPARLPGGPACRRLPLVARIAGGNRQSPGSTGIRDPSRISREIREDRLRNPGNEFHQ